ncbi:MAG: small multi-drug export protein [Clostridia bacterium]|nr:small multi-drug export protein [Clostridia bacterium]
MFFSTAFAEAVETVQAVEAAAVTTASKGSLIINALLSLVPTYEGRYAVVSAIGMGIKPVPAFFLALICSSIPIPLIMLLLRPVLDWLYKLPIGLVRRFAAWVEHRAEKKRVKMMQRRNKKKVSRFSAETAELIALYAFVAVPLPGTGVWTGTLIATLFGMPRLKSGIAIFLGNITACLITTLTTTGVLFAIG